MECVTDVQAGVCGFRTQIVASGEEEMVTFTVTTDCQKIAALAGALEGRQFDAYEEIHKGFEGELMTTVRANLFGCCAGCAVPVGLFKAMQVAARVALPKEAVISLSTE